MEPPLNAHTNGFMTDQNSRHTPTPTTSRSSSSSSSSSTCAPAAEYLRGQSTYRICNCGTPPHKAYLSPIIGCANKCRPRWFHLCCVGLTQHPYDGAQWYCPSCRGREYTHGGGAHVDRICVCEDPPYAFGPMVECAEQVACRTRWFHLPCVEGTGGEVGAQWWCGDCVAEIGGGLEQDVDEEMGEGELLGQIDGVMMEVYQDLDMPDLDGEHEEEHDEVQQEEVASSGEIIMAEQEDTREHGEVQQGEISSVDLPEAIMVEQKDVQEHKEVQQEDLLSSDMPETFMTQDQDTYGQTPEPHPQVLDSAALNVEMADSAPLDLLTPQKEHIQHSKSPEPILSPRWTSPAPEVADEVIVAARNTPPASSRHTSPLLPSRHNTPRVKEEDVTAIATNLSEEAPTGLPGGSEEAPVIHLDFDEEAPAFHPDADQQAPFIYPDADHLNFDDEALIIHPDVDEEAPLINPDADEEVTITDTDIDQDASIVYLGTDEEASPKIVAPDQDAESIAEEAEATSQFCVEGCGGDDAGPMIACDSNCTRQWFHYPCVGLTDATNPRGGWHCPSCRPAATPKKRSRRSAANTDQKMHSHQATEDKIRARGTGEPKYCIKLCLSPANNNMIACDANCSQAWFHFECVGLKTSTVPEGSWYCPGCRLKEERQAKARALRRRG